MCVFLRYAQKLPKAVFTCDDAGAAAAVAAAGDVDVNVSVETRGDGEVLEEIEEGPARLSSATSMTEEEVREAESARRRRGVSPGGGLGEMD